MIISTTRHHREVDRHRLSTLTAVVAVIGVLMTMVFTLVPQVFAAERSADYIKSASLARSSGTTKDSPLVTGEYLTFSFNWDASEYYGTDKAPQKGDTMVVDLPAWAEFSNATVAMTDDTGNAVANCVQASTEVTCTFTDYVNGKRDLKGAYNSTLRLVETETITETSFPVGPADVVVDLATIATPEVIAGGITTPAAQPAPKSPLNETDRKTGNFIGVAGNSGGKAIVDWIFTINGTGNATSITDAFTSGQTRALYLDQKPDYTQSVQVTYRDRTTEGAEGGSWNMVDSSRPGTARLLPPSEYQVQWNAANNEVTVNLPSTSTDRVYRIMVYTQLEADGLQNGDILSNTGTIDDKEVKASSTARNMISAYASGRDGFGSAYVYKQVNGIDPVPDDYVTSVKAELTFPDGTTEERVLDVHPGMKPSNAGQLKDLPTGTKVTLSEVTPADVPGYDWQGATFGEGKMGDLTPKADVVLSEDRSSVTLTIRNGGVTEIGITNAYTETPPRQGQFSVTKNVVADGVTVPDDKTFVMNYTCTMPGEADVTGSLNVAAGQTVESPLINEGYSCAVVEDESGAQVELLDLSVDNGQAVEIVADEVTPITVTNTYVPLLGDFTIVKNVTGLEEGQTHDYSFNYTCELNGATVKQGNVSVTGPGEETVADVPQGAVCTITEDTTTAAVPGYALVVDEAEPVTIGTTPQLAVVNNTYTKEVGSFSITKKLVDTDNVATGKQFTFDYVCTQPQSGEKQEGTLGPIGADESATAEGIAAGSICTLTERDASVARADLSTSGLDAVTILNGETENVEVTNEYSAWRADVKVIKNLTGSAADMPAAQEKAFTVNYVCQLDPQDPDTEKWEGTVEVSANQPAVIESLRSGADCVFTEDADKVAVDGADFNEDLSTMTSHVIVGDKDQVVEAHLTNDYSVIPPEPEAPSDNGEAPPTSNASTPPPSDPASEKPADVAPTHPDPEQTASPTPVKLANTGSETITILALAFVMMLAGSGALMLHRRR